MAGASASKMPEFFGDDVEDAPEFDNCSWDGWTPVGWVRFFFWASHRCFPFEPFIFIHCFRLFRSDWWFATPLLGYYLDMTWGLDKSGDVPGGAAGGFIGCWHCWLAKNMMRHNHFKLKCL